MQTDRLAKQFFRLLLTPFSHFTFKKKDGFSTLEGKETTSKCLPQFFTIKAFLPILFLSTWSQHHHSSAFISVLASDAREGPVVTPCSVSAGFRLGLMAPFRQGLRAGLRGRTGLAEGNAAWLTSATHPPNS